jgi:hypothetical protein
MVNGGTKYLWRSGLFSLELQAKDIRLTYERDPSLDFIGSVTGDAGRFTQV